MTDKSYYLCIMKLRKDIQQLADQLGADVEIWADSENSYTIEATAPDGMQWAESGSISLVSRFFTLWPETKAEACNDILERMRIGLEPETV